MRTICIFTAQIGKYKGADGIDITVGSARGLGKILAPSKAIVYGHKHYNGDKRYTDYEKVDDKTYRETYRLILIDRYVTNKNNFLAFLRNDEITLMCYCRADKFCHRHQAAEILQKIGLYHGINVILQGER
jgi:uncharacterized protein YeaO (DUF488 family)